MSYHCDRRGGLWFMNHKYVSGQKFNTRIIDAPRLQSRRRLYSSQSGYYITDDGQLYHAPTNRIINHGSIIFREVLKLDDSSQLVLDEDKILYLRNNGSNSLSKIIDKVEFVGSVVDVGTKINFIISINKEWIMLSFQHGDHTLTPIQGDNLPTGSIVDYRRMVLTIDCDDKNLYYQLRIRYGTIIRHPLYSGYSITITPIKTPVDVIDILGPGCIGPNTSVGWSIMLNEDGTICDSGYYTEFKKRDGTTPWVDLHRDIPWIGIMALTGVFIYNQEGELYNINMIRGISESKVFNRIENIDSEMFLDYDASKRIASARFTT